ncbi:FUSC family protein [Rugosimonospora africana]|uniref:FUSC family protein n=1 Tax=Rugosimonospora africana TaxID=556532 RepID=A0A8J3VWG8_9ACTN|nr:FUSC family protein [Rugosimonospora africana]GIH20831.1 FUSC family protein [Rugosimonospora africana]
MAGSDPGWTRLRMAVSGGVAIATALALEYGISRATHASAQAQVIAMMLGAVVAMMGSMALTAASAWANARTAAFFPVALGAGMAAGVAVGRHTDLTLIVFVVVMFVAVIIRRFGAAFFFYGFQLWMGYFFASFTHATVGTLPSMLVTVVAASAWVLLLSVTVLRTSSRRALARTRRAFAARSRDVARMSAALLETAVTDPEQVPRARRRLTAHQARLAEAALMIEAWSAEPGALPAGHSAVALRRHLLDAQLAIDGVAAAAGELAASGQTGLIVEAAGVTGLLAGNEYAAADRAARDLLARDPVGRDAGTAREHAGPGAASSQARHLAASTAQFVAVARRGVDRPTTDPADRAADEFEPAVSLAMGNLPGSPAFASAVAPRGRRWNPLTRLDFVARQAVQAAVAGGLAILIGREISPARYYWAVLAAFIAFSGTATRSETSIKAVNRVIGTVAGLVAGLALAHATTGHTMWILAVVVASMSAGLYLMRISYRYMIFFITIMIAQLYSVLHELSDALLMLRLEETAAGAAIGITVALLLAPLSTRDVVGTVRGDLFTALGDLLRAAADHAGAESADAAVGGQPADTRHDLDALIRAVDTRLYQLRLAAAPLTRPLVWGNSPSRTRHRLTLYAATAHYARSLAAAVRTPGPSPRAGQLSGALADAVTAMAPGDGPDQSPRQRRALALAHLAAADEVLYGRPLPAAAKWPADPWPAAGAPAPADAAGDATLRALVHLRQLIGEIVEFALPGPGSPPDAGTGDEAEPSRGQSAPDPGEPASPPADRFPFGARVRRTATRAGVHRRTGDAWPAAVDTAPEPGDGTAGERHALRGGDSRTSRHRRRGVSRPVR